MLLRSSQMKKDIPLKKGRLVIGRRTDCDILLESSNSAVSRQHAELQVDEHRCEVRDLESRNGTLINGQPLEPQLWTTLRDGDVIGICEYEFNFLESAVPTDSASSGTCRIVTGGGDPINAGNSISLSKQTLPSLPNQLRALLVMTAALRDVLNPDEMMRKAIDSLFEIFPAAQRAVIGFVDEHGQFSPECWRVRDDDPQDIQLSHSVLKYVLERGEAVVIEDAHSFPTHTDSVFALKMRSILCSPLMNVEGRAIGLVHVDSATSGHFNDFDLELLAAVSTQISLAVNFRRLHTTAIADAIILRDVENARIVQQAYLPECAPQVDGYDLAGFYRPARHIGGDYYDYLPLADGRMALVVGDVVGKGVPAALTMIRLATETRSSIELCDTPAETLKRLNRRLPSSFITIAIAILDPRNHTVAVSNAGHELPLLRRANRVVEQVGGSVIRCPISVFEDEQYVDTIIPLEPGDSLTLFSDGFPDAESADGKRFGKARLQQLLKQPQASSQAVVDTIVNDALRFIGNHPQFDDMCLLVIRRR